MDNIPREFQGVWIPKQIWLNAKLDYFEKALWAELNSLDNDQTGCTASNPYLCKIMGVPERTLQRGLSNLKKLGFIKYTDFDGRKRTIRTFSCSRPDKNVTEGVTKMSPLGRQKCHPEILDKILDKNPPPLPPQKDKQVTGFLKKEEEEEEILKPTKEEREELDRRFNERKGKEPIKVKKRWEQAVLKQMREQQKQADEVVKTAFLMETRRLKHRQMAQRHSGQIIDLPWKKMVTIHASSEAMHLSWDEDGRNVGMPVDYSISDEEWEIMTGWKPN